MDPEVEDVAVVEVDSEVVDALDSMAEEGVEDLEVHSVDVQDLEEEVASEAEVEEDLGEEEELVVKAVHKMESLKKHHYIISSPPTLWQACNTNCSSSQEQLFLFLFNTNYFPSFLTVGVFKGHFNFKFLRSFDCINTDEEKLVTKQFPRQSKIRSPQPYLAIQHAVDNCVLSPCTRPNSMDHVTI